MASLAMRQARVLALCQALFTSAISVDLTLTGLVGYTLAPTKALATLPFALITVAGAATAMGVPFVIERFGRRFAFCLGGVACMLGGWVSVAAIWRHDFWLFCGGTALVGVFQSFARFYRLAAADAAPVPEKPRAISVVLTGGVVVSLLALGFTPQAGGDPAGVIELVFSGGGAIRLIVADTLQVNGQIAGRCHEARWGSDNGRSLDRQTFCGLAR